MLQILPKVYIHSVANMLFYTFRIFFVCFFLIFLTQCNPRELTKLSTELRIKVVYNDSSVINANVSLYRNKADMESRIRRVASATTNSEGIALFKDVPTTQFYVYAYTQQQGVYCDNSEVTNVFYDDLVEGAITVATIQVKEARPINPSKMVFSSLELIKYDTTEWRAATLSHCSEVLVFDLIGVRQNNLEQVVGSTSNNPRQLCYIQGILQPSFSIPFDQTVELNITDYKQFYLEVYKIDENGNRVGYSPFYYTTYLNLNISDAKVSEIAQNPKGLPYPTRVRLMEGLVKSPPAIRGIETIVDAKILWK